MIHTIRVILLMVVILAVPRTPAGDTKEKAKAEANKFTMSKQEQTLLQLLNKEREKKKLPPLRPNRLLFDIARRHSANMAKQRKMEHVLNGKNPGQRVLSAGYDYGKIAENIAESEGGASLAAIVKGWMESKIHRDNLLDEKVSETGLGIVENDKGEIYYTQLFARPRKVIKRRD